jgi:hypothetical protein
MTRLSFISSFLLLAMLFFGCTIEEATVIPTPYQGAVDPQLLPYYEAFEAEAAIRGVEVDFDAFPIPGDIQSIQEDNIAGTCTHYGGSHHEIVIDLEYWNAASTLRREMVVFHELGHCYLGLGHKEDAFDNGICTSIMNSGTAGCHIAYSAQNRDYYLDELFSQP